MRHYSRWALILALAMLSSFLVPIEDAIAEECRWFGTKPFCDGQCPGGWRYTGKRESCTTGSRRFCCKVETPKADAGTCTRYANKAVAAATANVSSASCNKQGPRWTRVFNDHFNWCRGQDPKVVKGEEDAREKELNDCLFAGAPKSPGTFSGNLVNGIEILSDTPNGRGTIRLASNTTFLSSGSVCGLLNSLRPQADRMLVDQVRAFANPKIKPFSVRSDARSQLTSACTARAEVRSAGGENLTLTVKLPRNIFFFNVTTPGPLPGGTDPRFSIDYNLEARIPIAIPARPREAIGFGPVSVSVTNIKPDSQNLTGDIVKGLNSVVTFITGKDLAAKYLQNQYMSFAGVRKNLSDLSAQLNRVPANYRIDKSVNGTTLVLRATGKAPPQGPVVR